MYISRTQQEKQRAYPERSHLMVPPASGDPQRQPIRTLTHKVARRRVRELVVIQCRQRKVRLGIEAPVHVKVVVVVVVAVAAAATGE